MISDLTERAGINTAVALRYALAGGAASGLNFLSRFPLSQALPFEYAVMGAQGIGFLAGFLFYRAFVFRDAGTGLGRQIGAFAAVNLVSSAIVLAVAVPLRAFLTGLDIPIALAEAAAHAGGIGSAAVFNFIGHRILTFTRKQPA